MFSCTRIYCSRIGYSKAGLVAGLAALLSCLPPVCGAQSTPARPASAPKRASVESDSQAAQLAAQAKQALASGRFDEAEAALTALAKLQPGTAEIEANLGAVYFEEGKFDAATEHLREALRLKPSLSRSRTLLALSLAESGNSKAALPGLEAGFRDTAQPQVRPAVRT